MKDKGDHLVRPPDREMDGEEGETVQLADLVSSAAASVREARVAADTWQQIQR